MNADFESGYAHDPEGVAANVRLCIDTGVAGLSIEDATGDQRIRSSSSRWPSIASAPRAPPSTPRHSGVLLTARAECYLVNHPDPLNESLRRLDAYAEAGADVLYAPGPTNREDIKTLSPPSHPNPSTSS